MIEYHITIYRSPLYFSPQSSPPVLYVAVVGAGPAGLRLASSLGERGLRVAIIGTDTPFTNNYGVWMDEFEATGLQATVEKVWEECACYFGEGPDGRVSIKRAYGRLNRKEFRTALAKRCKAHGVAFLNATVTDTAAVNAEGREVGNVRTG